MNIICTIWGHDEVVDMRDPISYCVRCNQEMTQYDYPNPDLSPSLNVGDRLFRLLRKFKRPFVVRWDQWKWRHGFDEDEIPF